MCPPHSSRVYPSTLVPSPQKKKHRKSNYWYTYTHWNDQIPAASPLMIIESPITHIHTPEVISCEELHIASLSQLLRTLFNRFLSGLFLFFGGWGGVSRLSQKPSVSLISVTNLQSYTHHCKRSFLAHNSQQQSGPWPSTWFQAATWTSTDSGAARIIGSNMVPRGSTHRGPNMIFSSGTNHRY